MTYILRCGSNLISLEFIKRVDAVRMDPRLIRNVPMKERYKSNWWTFCWNVKGVNDNGEVVIGELNGSPIEIWSDSPEPSKALQEILEDMYVNEVEDDTYTDEEIRKQGYKFIGSQEDTGKIRFIIKSTDEKFPDIKISK
ncbi:hypothetical protein [Peribacillus asahii]|uniref:hypothetical protein n=1 Tax=Peribacillus asahii TaxID=228899 RepID=UPI0037FF5434